MLVEQPTPIRYSKRAILEDETLASLLETALVGRIGVIAEREPYIVPMNYAYDREGGGPLGRVIIHGADQGRLLRSLSANPAVCFEIDTFLATVPHPVLCEYDTAYASVICSGRAHLLTVLEERTTALRVLARKYATPAKAATLKGKTVDRFRSDSGASTAVIEIVLESVTGKQYLGPDAGEIIRERKDKPEVERGEHGVHF
jgi:nitroimidazol reductase NimA-like FMN-containing flavoprotein (pyridoxamine 5'-phosphate oxidase superfamily)